MATRKDRSKLVLWDSVCKETAASGLLHSPVPVYAKQHPHHFHSHKIHQPYAVFTLLKFPSLPHQESDSILPCPQRTTPEFHHLCYWNLQPTLQEALVNWGYPSNLVTKQIHRASSHTQSTQKSNPPALITQFHPKLTKVKQILH